MQKPAGYDEAAAYTGEFDNLPAGGYVCEIIEAKEDQTRSGRPMLVLAFDIAEGEHKGYFKRRFENDTRPDKKWPGTYRQLTDGTSTPFFKGMMTSIEVSNPGFKWDFDEKKLKGKKIGVIFGREEFEKTTGGTGWTTRAQAVRSVKTIKDGNFTVPEDKHLAGGPKPASSLSIGDIGEFEEVATDDGLPF